MSRLTVIRLAALVALGALPLCGCAPSRTAPGAQVPGTDGRRGASRTDADQSVQRLKELSLALQKYLADHGDRLPNLTNMDAVKRSLSAYISDDAVFIDPESDEPYGINSILSGKRLIQFAELEKIVVFYEEQARAGGARRVAFLDGHTAAVSGSEWDEVKRTSGIR